MESNRLIKTLVELHPFQKSDLASVLSTRCTGPAVRTGPELGQSNVTRIQSCIGSQHVSNLQLDAPAQGIEQTVPLCGATRRDGVMEQRTPKLELYQGGLHPVPKTLS